MSVRIVTDSAADLTAAVKERITAVPLTLFFGQQEYADGVTITQEEFYRKLVQSDVLPTTSQPNPSLFEEVYAEATAAGDAVVVITISSGISGTYQSACIAAEDYDNVFVVDSQNAALATGCLAQRALELVDCGLEAREIAGILDQEKKNLRLFAVLDTLEYLKKGGRISGAVAFVGGMLSIKPMITLEDGKVAVVGKPRGNKMGNKMLMAEIEKAGGIDYAKPFLLGYTGLEDTLLQGFIADSEGIWEGCERPLPQTVVGSVIGTHVGPGAVAVAFFANEKE